MSLARIALRIAAVEALKGQTLVGDNVLDSPNGALDIAADGTLRTDVDTPFISVYTAEGRHANVTGRTLVENGECDLVFELAIASAMTELDEETGASTIVGIGIPASDRSFEFFLDIVQRQIFDALTDPENVWAEIYRGLHYAVGKIEFSGARNTDDGQRLAGHQIRLTVMLADDPIKGEVLSDQSALMRFVAALEGSDDASYQAQAATMRAVMCGGVDDRQMLQRIRGLTLAEAAALGEVPLDDAAATINTVVVERLTTTVVTDDQ
ncbi:hypothetical protein [Rhizobium halophytocola]|uniref:Uncharacterized protein n=1 Tax=Rhizobium halophytocola TaxID=735519 RepID=A0ABS4E2G4_9HYPH|nr:hypothetical protein [Rhizobium halophytocola]MBP1852122.1 hypothetical protein [Rhizobium halophytocola]